MPVYTSLAKLDRQESELQELMKQYTPIRDRYLGEEEKAFYHTLGLTENAHPSIKEKFNAMASFEEEVPEWFIQDPEEMQASLDTMARLGGQFAYTFIKGMAEMAKAPFSPTTANEMRYKQMKDLIMRHKESNDWAVSRDLQAQMQAVSPYLHNRYLAQTAAAFQGLLIGVAGGTKLAKGIKGLFKSRSLLATKEGQGMWANYVKQIKEQAKALKKQGAKGLKDRDLFPVGVNPKYFIRQAELALEPWMWSMAVGLAARNIDDIQDEGIKKVVLNMANDPMGVMAGFGLGVRGARTATKHWGKFGEKPRPMKISDATEDVADRAINAVKRDTYSEVVPETFEQMKESKFPVLNKIETMKNELERRGTTIENETYLKMRDVVDGTKRKETLNDLTRAFAEDPGEMDRSLQGDRGTIKGLWDKYSNSEMRYIFNPEARSLTKIMNEIGEGLQKRLSENEFARQHNDLNGKKRYAAFEEGVAETYEKFKKNEIKMSIDEFLDTLNKSKDEAIDYLSGKHPSIKKVFDAFHNELAKDSLDWVKNIEEDVEPFPDHAATRLTKEKAEIHFGKTRAEVLEEATKKAEEREPTFTEKIGFSVRDLTRDIKYQIEEIFMKESDNIKGLTPIVKELMKEQIAAEVKEMSKGAKNPPEFINNLYKYTHDVFKDKVALAGFKPSVWNKAAEAFKEGKLSEKDFRLMVTLMKEYDLNPKSPLKMSGFKTNIDGIMEKAPKESLPAVFKFVNEVYTEILTNRKGRAKGTHKLVEMELLRHKLAEIKEIPGEVKGEITKFWGKLDENYKNELMTKAEEFKQALENKYKLKWGEKGSEKIYDFAKPDDFNRWLRNVMTINKHKQIGKELEPVLTDQLEGIIEKISDQESSLFQLKSLDIRTSVLDSLGMDFIRKYEAGVDLHIRPMIKDHVVAVKDLQKTVKKFKKKGKRVDSVLIRDFMEGELPSKDLNLIERGVARKLRRILDHWGEYKAIFPEFDAIKNYMKHQVVEGYFRNWFAFSTDMVPKWLDGFKEAERNWMKRKTVLYPELERIKKSRMSEAEKQEQSHKLVEDYAKVEERFLFYQTSKSAFLNDVENSLARAFRSEKINKETYDTAVKQLREKGAVEGKELTEVMEYIEESPYYVKNRISAGIDNRMDQVEYYSYNILKEGNFPVERLRTLSPSSALMMVLKKRKQFRGRKENLPAYFDRDAMIEGVRQFAWGYRDGTISPNRMSVLRHIFEYDKLQRSVKDVLPFMSEKKIDTSLLNRTQNAFMAYKARDPMQEVLVYLEQADRGISWNPVAKVVNTLKDYIEGNPDLKIKGASAEVAGYLDSVLIDLVGRETKGDKALKGLILGGQIPIVSDMMIKGAAKKRGIQNPEVYRMGQKTYVKGQFFDPHLQKVIEVEGVPAEEMLPKRILNRSIENLKLLNYMAALGLSPRSALLNTTQVFSALSMEQKSTAFGLVPKMETINNAMTAYHKTLKELINPKEMKRIHRIGVVDQALRTTTEGYLETTEGVMGKMAKGILVNMTATEYLNRVAMFEYFKLMHKDVFKSMKLNEKMQDVLARDFSDKYNFRIDALNQPNFLRGASGKLLGHLSTFAYHQSRMFAKEGKKFLDSIPELGRQGKETFKALGKGDWEGFKTKFDKLNNTQRLGVIRYMFATMGTVYMMNSLLGFSISTVMWNRSLNMPLLKNPLMTSIQDMYDVITGEKPIKAAGRIGENFIPVFVNIKKVGRALEKGDMRYVISNTKEIVPTVKPDEIALK